MKNRWTINLFVDKNDGVTKRNFSCELQKYDVESVRQIVVEKLDLNEKKWTIETSEEWEVVEKESVIFWKVKLKKV